MFSEEGYATMKSIEAFRTDRRKGRKYMTNTTKAALEASLKKLLLKKPLDKITINDLTTDCGISRMAFYYHFKDIYDLVEWSCLEDATQALQGKKTYETWQEGVLQIFEAMLENKPFIMNVYHSVSREQIETYLFHLTHDLLYGVVQEKAKGTGISEADQSFIADFYKYSFTGVMLDWIKDGMKADYHVIAEKMHRTMEGNVVNSIQAISRKTNKILYKTGRVIKILSSALFCKWKSGEK